MDRLLCKAKTYISDKFIKGHYIHDGISDKHYIFPFGNSCNEPDNIKGVGILTLQAFMVNYRTICQSTGRKPAFFYTKRAREAFWSLCSNRQCTVYPCLHEKREREIITGLPRGKEKGQSHSL